MPDWHVTETGARHYLGARVRPFDPRELHYRLAPAAGAAVDLSRPRSLAGALPPVFDQGPMGSCVANATVAGAMALGTLAGFDTVPMLDRLYLYYACRVFEGTFPQDAGSYPADAADVATRGLPPESAEPGGYVADPARVPAPDPRYGVYDYVASHRPFYATDPGGYLGGLCAALDAGMPVLVALAWQEGFWPQDGVLPVLPPAANGGGHCVYAWGYQPDSARGPLVWCRNSWGPAWYQGDPRRTWAEAGPGDFAIPEALLTNGTVWEMRALSGEAVPPPAAPDTDGYGRALNDARAVYQNLALAAGKHPRSTKLRSRLDGAGDVVRALEKGASRG